MLKTPAEPISSLYIHVPFCARKCSYCAFYSEASSGELVNRYVEALIGELELVASDLRPRTVFFGGGTPSLLNLRQWEQILRAMERLNLLGAEEWTVECNPATISLDKANLLRSVGVNRISMGVQSLDEILLERLGRVHSREMVFKSFAILRQAGFENVNLDLMFAIPGQTMERWQRTLTEALAMQSEHLSCYEVIYEEDTALYAQLQAGEFEVDDDLACDMYEALIEKAGQAGFQQYEIANFAQDRNRQGCQVSTLRSAATEDGASVEGKHPSSLGPRHLPLLLPAHACAHNVNYWRGGFFYGLGPSATSYVRGVRSVNCANTRLYCHHLQNGGRPIDYREELPPLSRAGETAAFGLRLLAGWPFEQFRQITGQDLRQEWAGEMAHLTERGWGRLSQDRFQLTQQGLRFADAAAELFLR